MTESEILEMRLCNECHDKWYGCRYKEIIDGHMDWRECPDLIKLLKDHEEGYSKE